MSIADRVAATTFEERKRRYMEEGKAKALKGMGDARKKREKAQESFQKRKERGKAETRKKILKSYDLSERVAVRHLIASLPDHWMTRDEVTEICPPCGEKMSSLNITEIRASAFFGQDVVKLAAEKEAKGWSKLPKGWTDESLKKFWSKLTGDVKHKVTACIKKMEGKLDNPGAFCASANDRITGTTKWRGPKKD